LHIAQLLPTALNKQNSLIVTGQMECDKKGHS